jgi:hypothetical protein
VTFWKCVEKWKEALKGLRSAEAGSEGKRWADRLATACWSLASPNVDVTLRSFSPPAGRLPWRKARIVNRDQDGEVRGSVECWEARVPASELGVIEVG